MPAPLKTSARQVETEEFVFTQQDFRVIADLVYRHTGIVLGSHKASMVYSRLSRRLRELGLRRFEDYCRRLEADPNGEEFLNFTNAMTTNLTRFFRENHHFEYLADTILPDVRARGTRRMRIWSAGCSSGEEPYSLAATIAENFNELPKWDVRILATDIDTNMLAKGREAIYRAETLNDVKRETRDRWFSPVEDGYRVKDALRQMIAFKPLNLLESWPMSGSFDAIFCRNVMIYFDNPTKTELVRRFCEKLRPGGWLIVGHSETLLDQQNLFRLCGRTIYRKPEA